MLAQSGTLASSLLNSESTTHHLECHRLECFMDYALLLFTRTRTASDICPASSGLDERRRALDGLHTLDDPLLPVLDVQVTHLKNYTSEAMNPKADLEFPK